MIPKLFSPRGAFRRITNEEAGAFSGHDILRCHYIPRRFSAHHGEANYDTEKTVSIKGTVTAFEFVNPHVQITLDVKNDKGETEKWIGEARSPAMLSAVRRVGQEHDQSRRRDHVLWTSNQERDALHAPGKNRDAGREGIAEFVGCGNGGVPPADFSHPGQRKKAGGTPALRKPAFPCESETLQSARSDRCGKIRLGGISHD